MISEKLSLEAIDFSHPDGEFIFKGQPYLLKYYFKHYFIKNKTRTSTEFIYLFDDEKLAKNICNKSLSSQAIEQALHKEDYIIRRCVQYQEALFSFGTSYGKYYLPIENDWIYLEYLNCEYYQAINLTELLEKPYTFFLEFAKTVYEKELPLIDDENLYYAALARKTKATEFICGSQSELERLTKLATYILPELYPLFEYCPSFQVIYKSESEYHKGGVKEVCAEDKNGDLVLYSKDEDDEDILSQQSQQLLDLIFEYNYFTGIEWEYNDGAYGYGGHDPYPCTIEVEVYAPSQHERIEAALELQSWLEGKLPEAEIITYFE